jgi:hypothetical protein
MEAQQWTAILLLFLGSLSGARGQGIFFCHTSTISGFQYNLFPTSSGAIGFKQIISKGHKLL